MPGSRSATRIRVDYIINNSYICSLTVGNLKNILACLVLVSLLCSCEAMRSLVHDGEVVARVGKHELYRADLEAMIPHGLSQEDSLAVVSQYVNGWISEQLFLDMADTQLSKEEKDVTAELEAYRRSLLTYRYEQNYVNERLDTVITFNELEEYYESHQDMFYLDVPILKVRYIDIMQDSPNLDIIRRNMSSDGYEDLHELDSLAWSSAIRYIDSSSKWIDAVSLANEFGTDYATMLSKMNGSYIESVEDRGDVKIAYVIDIHRGGRLAPLDYCEERIRNIILSTRKHAILSNLEQDLLEDARANGKFEISVTVK